METRNCVICGKVFKAKPRNKKCCSPRCSSRNWKNNHPDYNQRVLDNLKKGNGDSLLKKYSLTKFFLENELKTKSLKDVGKETGLSHEWIRLLCKANGIRMRAPGRIPLGLTREFLLKELAQKSISEFAHELGCTTEAIRHNILKFRIKKKFEALNKKRKRRRCIEKFWNLVNKQGPAHRHIHGLGECWLWQGPRIPVGYGRTACQELAHRFSYQLHFGRIPRGLWCGHKCDNQLCVNPRHLYLVTPKQRVRDSIQRGRRKGRLYSGASSRGSRIR